VRPVDLGSFLRTPQISNFFELSTPRIRVQIARVVETKGYLFLGKRNVAPSPATHIKLSATVLIVFHHFLLLPSYLPLPSPFTAPWLTSLFIPPLLHRPTSMTQGMTPGRKALRWQPLLLQLVVPQKCERGNPRTHQLLQEDDHRAYHDHG
jgi:hypothetical protein